MLAGPARNSAPCASRTIGTNDSRCVPMNRNVLATTDLDVTRWYGKRPVCSQCLSERNLEVCVQCQALFSKADRSVIPGENDKYVCPICAPSHLSTFAATK